MPEATRGTPPRPAIDFSRRATLWCFTSPCAIWHLPAGAGRSFDAWEWQNKFQITQTGRGPVDPGFLVEIERPTDHSESHELRWGLPLLTQFEF